MDMKTFLQQATKPEREELAKKVDSTVGYFYQIAGGHKRPGAHLCKALVAVEQKLTLAELRPDIWTQGEGRRIATRNGAERRTGKDRRSDKKT
jgi:hypothetical protein